jgi:hypothetical protein
MARMLMANTNIPAKAETVENLLKDFLGKKNMVSQGITRCKILMTVVTFITNSPFCHIILQGI